MSENKLKNGKDKKYIFENSIVINGPIGSGKTLISCALSDSLKMEVLNLDTMRFLLAEHTYDSLLREKLDVETQKCFKFKRSLRKQYPKIKNYYDFGYNANVAQKFRKYLGEFGFYLYLKQFDNMMLEEVLKKLDRPCIIDMGGTMGISLDEKYKSALRYLMREDPDLVYEKINTDYMGREHIQKFMERFDHVIELQLPDNYETLNIKASKCSFNRSYINSGMYSKTANIHLSVAGLVTSVDGTDDINMKRLDEIVDKIKVMTSKENAERE